jgi:hypothetical protein
MLLSRKLFISIESNKVKELKKYLKDALGVDAEIRELTPARLKALPIYLAEEYRFHLTELYRQDILLVIVKNSFTTDSLRKHLDTIRSTFNTITIAVIDRLEAYKRMRLIEKKVPFIVPGKQMYMPDLLIDLKEFGLKPQGHAQNMQPATQFLLLYHLQIELLEGINLKGIAEKLNYNAMTITRAVYYLHNMGLCTLQGTKDKFLHFESNKRDLWEKAVPFMNNPVKKTQYYNGWIDDKNLYKSNMNALAHYSDMNEDVIEYYAVKPGYTSHIGGVNLKPTGPLEGNICIEEWKYNPFFLARQGFVDPLSLYLYFRNEPDERIEMSLEQLISKIAW